MSKRKRGLTMLLGLALIGGLSFLVWPRDCDASINGRISASAWASNAWARISGGWQDCDPWNKVGPRSPVNAILISYSINAYAGPSSTDLYTRPDGYGYVYHFDFSKKSPIWLTPEAAHKLLSSGNYRGSFTFMDKAVYREVRNLVGPLRNATGPIPREFRPFGASVNGKVVINCELEGYHSNYKVDWSPQPLADTSYFDNSGAHDQCPALRSAVARLGEAKRLMQAKVPQKFVERWFKENRSKAKN